jgi:predicted nucleic acid-binding protein
VNLASRKFVLDTQLFIDAFRDDAANQALQAFHRAFSPVEFLSVIVAQELRTGARRATDRRALERHLIRVFERVNRTITPSADAWHRSGDVLAEMARTDGLEVARVSKAFGNDLLLALSCRESGCVLVTRNESDFRRIRRFVPFEYVPPWPRRSTHRDRGCSGPAGLLRSAGSCRCRSTTS